MINVDVCKVALINVYVRCFIVVGCVQKIGTSQEGTWDNGDVDVVWKDDCIFSARVAALVGAHMVVVA